MYSSKSSPAGFVIFESSTDVSYALPIPFYELCCSSFLLYIHQCLIALDGNW